MAATKNLTHVSLSSFVEDRGAPFPIDPSTDFVATPAGVPLPKDQLDSFHRAVLDRGVVCVLLAAGQGSRFKASLPKVIYPFAGKPLAQHALDVAHATNIPVVVVVGHARDAVCKTLHASNSGGAVAFIVQEEQMGTGHGVFLAKYALPDNYDGDIIVMYADNPGLDERTMAYLIEKYGWLKSVHGERCGGLILTGSRAAATDAADAYGRIVRATKSGGSIVDIVEKKTIVKLSTDKLISEYGDERWTPEELNNIDEFNSGIVVARAKTYLKVLASVVASQTKFDPPKFEYYATDFVKGMVADNLIVEGWTVPADEMWKLEGTNTLDELLTLEGKHAKRNSGV